MPAQLMALTEGPNILLDKPILLFGRNPECDIQIDSRKVSRRHCCLAQVSDYLVVRDLGSTNGIRINGVRINEGKLRNGDELTVGSHRYQVRWDPLDHRSKGPVRVEMELAQQGAAQPEDADDEVLESCDDPVPLPDPANDPRLAGTARPGDLGVEEAPTPYKPIKPLSIPDNLNLAPLGDSSMKPPRGKPS